MTNTDAPASAVPRYEPTTYTVPSSQTIEAICLILNVLETLDENQCRVVIETAQAYVHAASWKEQP